MRKLAQQFVDWLVPLSLFFGPFLIFSIDWAPSVVGPITRTYAIIFISMSPWAVLFFFTRICIRHSKDWNNRKLLFIFDAISLLLMIAASLISLLYLKQSVSPMLFYSVIVTLGFQGLYTGLLIRELWTHALSMQFLSWCTMSFLAFRIFEEQIIWQRLFFGLALSCQAFSCSLSKELLRRVLEFKPSVPALHIPKRFTMLFNMLVFVGPLLIGLLSLSSIIPFKYSLIYLSLFFSSRLVSEAAELSTNKEKSRLVRSTVAFYAFFLLCLTGIRLI